MSPHYLLCRPAPGGSSRLPPPLARALAEQGLGRRFGDRDLLLFGTGNLPVRSLSAGTGWTIGQLFDRQGRSAPDPLEAKEGWAAPSIVRHCWGAYVLVEQRARELRVMRDPSGGLPCYHYEAGGAHYVTSLPHLLVDCGLAAADLDWTEIARSLTDHSERGTKTAIRGLDEILAGTELAIVGTDQRRSRLWDPRIPASSAAPLDPAATLEACLTQALGAWGRSYRRPLIEISGGLDSAIVAAGVSTAAPNASLITFAPAPGDPDERPYARAIADRLGPKLETAVPDVGDVDLSRSLSAGLPRPNARAFTQGADRLSLGHARSIGADAFMSGGGGDDVFCYLRTISPAIDRLRVEGPAAMLRTALDIAAMTHATLWEALHRIAARSLGPRGPRSRRDLRFIARDAVVSDGPSALPALAGLPPGKAEHVRAVMTLHNHLEGHARAGFAPLVWPLLSQPIVECCLSIPSWRWCEDGLNRAVARRAFRKRLPAVVLDRRSKGRFDGFCAALLDKNRRLAEALLLDGRLAREGLLDRPALAAAMADPFPPAETVSRLLRLVDVESWAQSWAGRTAQGRPDSRAS